MQFIDKTLNRVIKWENRDISISEMLELIENEIIAKSSEKDLGQHRTSATIHIIQQVPNKNCG